MNVALDHSEASPSPEALERHISRASKALHRPSARRRPLVLRTRGRRDDPGRIRAPAAFSRRGAGSRTRAPDRRLPAPHPGRARRLAALPRRRVRHQRQRQGLFRPEDDRRRSRGAAYAPRARSDSRPWRRGEEQCLHPLPARALRRDSLERRSDHAGRDHAAAALVSVPPRQGLLLGAHGAGAAAGAAGAEAARRQSARRRDRGAVRRAAGDGAQLADRRASGLGVGEGLRRDRPAAQARRAAFSRAAAPPRDRRRRRLRDRAPQRRGRPRRDLSGDGERGADVRRARLPARPSRPRRGAPVDRAAAGRRRGRGLLPALPVAGLGHRARRPRAARSGRRGERRAGARRRSTG